MGDFKNVLKELRKASGLTQEELAKRMGITRSRLGMYESGAREPDFETLEAFADFFNVDIDYLMGRTNKTTVLPETMEHYYQDPEARELANFLFKHPDYRVLFDASRNVKKEDIELVKTFMDRLNDD